MIDKIVLVLLFLLCNAGMAYALELPFRQLSSAETSGLAGKSISGKMVQNDSLKAVVKRDSALASKEKEGKESEGY